MDIETGVRLSIPILTIVLNNQVLSGYPARYQAAVEQYGFTELYATTPRWPRRWVRTANGSISPARLSPPSSAHWRNWATAAPLLSNS